MPPTPHRSIRPWLVVLTLVLMAAPQTARAEDGAKRRVIVLSDLSFVAPSPPAPRVFYVLQRDGPAAPDEPCSGCRLQKVDGRAEVACGDGEGAHGDYAEAFSGWDEVRGIVVQIDEASSKVREAFQVLDRRYDGSIHEPDSPREPASRLIALSNEPGDLEQTEELIRQAAGGIASCYRRAQKGGVRRAVEASFMFRVDHRGRVFSARWLEGDLGRGADECLTSRFESSVFPRPGKGRSATYLSSIRVTPRAAESPSPRPAGAPPPVFVYGALSRHEAERVVRRSFRGIRACYERALRRDPTLGGRITIRFTVGASGRVVRARVEDNTVSLEVGRCLVARFLAMRFPTPEGGSVTFSFPFVFEPSE